jgi:hypothetical protein
MVKEYVRRTECKYTGQQPDQAIASENILPYTGNQKESDKDENNTMKDAFPPVQSSYITFHIISSFD